MFAFTILGLLVMVIFNLFPSSVLAVRQAERRLKATEIAQSLLEQKRAQSFDELGTGAALPPVEGEDGTVYRPVFTPFAVDGCDEHYLRGVRITVAWKVHEMSYSLSQECYVCNIPR